MAIVSPILRRLSTIFVVLSMIAVVQQPLSAQAPRSAVTTVTATPQGATASVEVGGVGAAFHPSRILVQFRPGPRTFLPGSGAARAFPGNPDLFLVNNPPGLAVAEVVRQYQANPNVLFAEPDFEVHAVDTIPGDPRWGEQWDMTNISAPAAWDTQKDANDVYVAIIDTGIDFTHPDLQGNVDSSNSFTCINGPCVSGGLDNHGHGTHVAGTIGAVHNGIGIAGINYSVKMLAFKFLDASGSGSVSDAVYAFNKIAELKQAAIPINIRVTSNSWGGGGFSQALKNAMAAVENLGIPNVCAAGNNGQNADTNPMYPAAYDNPGIISVLATDINNVGAGFTNYGLANVDIAAPGVSTLSTSPLPPPPPATCSLCDATGYKFLSGTSMATPHVTGVLAALMHLHPQLTAREARDVILDPASYIPVSDAKGKSSSSGGRLNFAKVIANPRGSNPLPLNIFPTVSMGASVFASAGNTVNLSATASDADSADVPGLRTAWSKSVSSGSAWLFGWMLSALFPDPSGSSVSFPAPSVDRLAVVPYDASVADNRGGGAHGQQLVTVSPVASPSNPPAGVLTVNPLNPAVDGTVTVNFPVTDDNPNPAWDMWAAGKQSSSGWCCFTGSASSIKFAAAGVFRVGVQALDRQLQQSIRQTAVVRVGGATGEPPIANATLDKLSGTVPFSVHVDMSGSSDIDGFIQYYFINCGGGGFTAGSSSSSADCTFTTPGTYWLMLQVQDNSGQMDLVSAYVGATPAAGPPPPGDTTPPTVSITAPTSGASVTGTINIDATASDPGGGVATVEFWLDNPTSGTLLGTDNLFPYSVSWNTGTTTPGAHTLYAIATDTANLKKTSAGVPITVTAPPPPPPTISIGFSPTPTRKGTVTVTAAVTYTGTITNVEFYNNGVLVGSDSSAPYEYKWKVPAAPGKTYSWTVKVYDSVPRVTTSSVFPVTVP